MRPLGLRIKGFTAFRDEQAIDFTDLDLFALWGPTGSGKSSILDAITYALYGEVERVGSHPNQLVSQGQPRMTVALDFAVGTDVYRVVRSTPAPTGSGSTTIRLERREGADWVTHGAGADQVRAANKAIHELIGLDYDAFTRSVILPQGRFAEFLAGDARDRRRILTELLGLELFKRMAQRSGEIARDARLKGDTKQGIVEREYLDAQPVALKEAKNRARAIDKKRKLAIETEIALQKAQRAWEESGRSLDDLAGLAEEIDTVIEEIDELAAEVESRSESLAAIDGDRAAAEKALSDAQHVLGAAVAARADAEALWGKPDAIAALVAQADQLERARRELEDAQRSLEGELAKERAAQDDATAAEELLKQARRELQAAERDLREQRARHDEVHGRDAVAALVADLAPGDPCPVCERPLDRVPDISRDALTEAKRSFESAGAAQTSAATAVSRADADLRLAQQAIRTAAEGVARCRSEREKRAASVTELEAALASVFEGSVPDDAQVRLSAVLAQSREAEAAERKAASASQQAKDALAAVEARSTEVAAQVAAARSRLGRCVTSPLENRLRAKLPRGGYTKAIPATLPEDPGGLARAARAAGHKLESSAAAVRDEIERQERQRRDEASAALGSVPPELDLAAESLDEMLPSVRAAVTRLSAESAVAKREVTELEDKIRKRAELEAQIASHREEQAAYGDLAKDLRDDRIVQFLQAEALDVLAAGASEHLKSLSGGRYKLVYRHDEFFVIDSWNGEERRSVRTLSGGETFLASLGLALALSEQIQLLSVGERHALESLFLDEGFGSLDAETLEVVVEAIENLGGEDRLVGVITHVSDVAARMPVRLQVTKSPRGSRIERAPGEPGPL